jgi:hypothetical protein
MIIGIPYALIPAIFSGLLLSFPLADILIVCVFVYSIVLGGIFVGVGITALNPSYEDTSSGAFVINQIGTIIVMMICVIVSIIPGVMIAINQGLFGYAMTISSIPTPIIGLVALMIGTIRLNFMEVG